MMSLEQDILIRLRLSGPSATSLRRRAFSDIPPPGSQCLDNSGRDRCRQWHSEKDEALVNGVSKRQLRCQTYRRKNVRLAALL